MNEVHQTHIFTRSRGQGGRFSIEPSADLGPKPELVWVPKEECYVDDRYQRQVTKTGTTLINRIVREFSWAKFPPLLAGPKTKHGYPIIDGQHRLNAAMLHPAVTEVPLWIIASGEVSDQADSFVAVNKDRQQVNPVNVFWAAVAAQEPDALAIKNLVEEAGVEVGRTMGGLQPARTTIALDLIKRMSNGLGPHIVKEALRVLAEAQPDTINLFRTPIIEGTIRLISQHKVKIDMVRLRTVLADLNMDDVLAKAKVNRGNFGGKLEAGVRLAFIKAYNHNLTIANRLSEDVNYRPDPAFKPEGQAE